MTDREAFGFSVSWWFFAVTGITVLFLIFPFLLHAQAAPGSVRAAQEVAESTPTSNDTVDVKPSEGGTSAVPKEGDIKAEVKDDKCKDVTPGSEAEKACKAGTVPCGKITFKNDQGKEVSCTKQPKKGESCYIPLGAPKVCTLDDLDIISCNATNCFNQMKTPDPVTGATTPIDAKTNPNNPVVDRKAVEAQKADWYRDPEVTAEKFDPIARKYVPDTSYTPQTIQKEIEQMFTDYRAREDFGINPNSIPYNRVVPEYSLFNAPFHSAPDIIPYYGSNYNPPVVATPIYTAPSDGYVFSTPSTFSSGGASNPMFTQSAPEPAFPRDSSKVEMIKGGVISTGIDVVGYDPAKPGASEKLSAYLNDNAARSPVNIHSLLSPVGSKLYEQLGSPSGVWEIGTNRYNEPILASNSERPVEVLGRIAGFEDRSVSTRDVLAEYALDNASRGIPQGGPGGFGGSLQQNTLPSISSGNGNVLADLTRTVNNVIPPRVLEAASNVAKDVYANTQIVISYAKEVIHSAQVFLGISAQ